MRFLLTYNCDQQPAGPEKLSEIGQLSDQMARAGVLLDTGGILPSRHGARIRLAGGAFTATDGPFAETKEMIVGYAILQVKSKEEAVEMARQFMGVAGDGEIEIRQLVGPGDGPCQ